MLADAYDVFLLKLASGERKAASKSVCEGEDDSAASAVVASSYVGGGGSLLVLGPALASRLRGNPCLPRFASASWALKSIAVVTRGCGGERSL